MITLPLWNWSDGAGGGGGGPAATPGRDKPFGYYYGWLLVLADILTRGQWQ